MSVAADPSDETDPRGTLRWIVRGMMGLGTLPAIILLSAMVGFGGLAREAGLTLGQAVFATFGVWALPSMIVMVGSITAGLGLLPTALAVALASVRFTPMVMSIVPEMRSVGTRRRTLYFLSHFVAITAWVYSLARFADVPRERRTAFFGGFAVTLTLLCTVVVGVVHQLAASLPTLATAVLVFLTPLYFLTSLWSNARFPADRPALLCGLALGPLMQLAVPSFGLIAAGLVGGTIAYLWKRRA